MTRDTILEKVLSIPNKAMLFQFPTGTGKTRSSIEKVVDLDCKNILVVAPKHFILDGWVKEFKTWGYESFLPRVTFICYDSLYKYVDVKWDAVIWDEAHHLSEAKCDIMDQMNIKYSIFLSATMKRDTLRRMKLKFPDLYMYSINTRTTIDEGILPDPKIILIPLTLSKDVDPDDTSCNIEINPKATKSYNKILNLNNHNYWLAKKQGDKKTKYTLKGSPFTYYSFVSYLIDMYKRKGMYSEVMKNKWLKLSGDRLKWLAKQKNTIVPVLLKKLKNERVLTFCCDIEQSELFGPNSINSKKADSPKILDDFNQGKIKHIQACAILDEGVNLVNCRIGIFVNINSSERIVLQRLGRILRHKEPVIIIPYFTDTREEELVKKMMENYNPELIKIITNINDLTL